LSRFRLIFAGACVALAAVIATFTYFATQGPRSNAVVSREVSSSPTAEIGGPFALVDQDGKPATEAVLKGKYSVVFFGFTFCPEVCPTTLQTLAAAQDRLGSKAKDLQIVFVSLDPERDTPAKVKQYLGNQGFPKNVVGLTGTLAQVTATAKAYRVYFTKSGEGDDYLIDHSTAAYVMDPKGKFVRVIPYGLSPDEVAKQIADAMRAG
jgi:protein SCO1/2